MLKALCLILLVISPAFATDISGTWDFTVNTDAGSGNPVFTFQQQGESLTGTYKGLLGEAKVTGTVKGDKIQFSFQGEYGSDKLKVEYSGVVQSDAAMKGTLRAAGLGEGEWTAKKR